MLFESESNICNAYFNNLTKNAFADSDAKSSANASRLKWLIEILLVIFPRGYTCKSFFALFKNVLCVAFILFAFFLIPVPAPCGT